MSSCRPAPAQSISCTSGAVKKSFADRTPAGAGPRHAGGDGYDWLAAIRSKSPRSTASSRPLRQLPFILRTNGDGVLR
jgi:hypothetical protein